MGLQFGRLATARLGLCVSAAFLLLSGTWLSAQTIELGQALNAPDLTWSTSGSVPWFGQTNITHDGIAAAQTGVVSPGQYSSLQTTVTGPATLTFWAMGGQSFPSFGMFTFYVNGIPAANMFFSAPWRLNTVYLGSGPQILTWSYSSYSGNSTGVVDQVTVTPGVTSPIITGPPQGQTIPAGTNMTFSVSAVGTPPLNYLWRFNGSDLTYTTSSSLTLTNVQTNNAGKYSVLVSNIAGSTPSSDAILVVTSSPPTITLQPVNAIGVVNGYAAFHSTALGSYPFTYQWQFNSNNLAGATNPDLLIGPIRPIDSAFYRVVVSNAYGAAFSTNAFLSIARTALIAWGNNMHGQCSVPPLTNVISISAGGGHALAVKQDATVVAWGNYYDGQTNVPPGLLASMISAGEEFSLALSTNRVVAWGWNYYGQTNVPATVSNVVAISAGRYHGVALKANGTAVAWGQNTLGQTNVPAGLDHVVAIDAGAYHNVAVKDSGALIAWGWNLTGQSTIPPGVTNVVAAEAGQYHSVALQANGRLTVWGDNGFGQTNVPSGATNVVAISAGDLHTLALRADGTVVAWGAGMANDGSYNNSGQSIIPAGLTNVIMVSGGQTFSMALQNDGSPFMARQPLIHASFAGADTFLSVGAVGIPPLNYQWYVNGTNIPNATNSVLALSTVPLSAAGNYFCVVTNALGAVTSSPAPLVVSRSIPYFETASGAISNSAQGLELTLRGLSGHGQVTVYSSADLVTWTPILTNPPVLGTLRFVDAAATNSPMRVYRAEED